MFAAVLSCCVATIGTVAHGAEYLDIQDIKITSQPRTADLANMHKMFEMTQTDYAFRADKNRVFWVTCHIGSRGHFEACSADARGIADKEYVGMYVRDCNNWIAAETDRKGGSVIGRAVRFPVQM